MNTFDLSKKYIMDTYNRFEIAFEYGKGCYLFDENGKSYLDFVSGIAVNCLGYQNQHFIEALCSQITKLNHVSNLYYSKKQVEAAKLIVEASGLDKVFFCNSGAEANEAALKLARKHAFKVSQGKKSKIIAMKNSFHGRTLGALTLTGQEKYQKAFKPLISNVEYAEFNNLESVQNLIDENTCAVIMECIQGEGGVIPSDKEFYFGIRELCDKYQALMIVDEVQTGVGRTGEYFAFQNYAKDYKDFPDIICLAKALGNGVPIGAIAAKDNAAASFEPGDHASTFGGNYLAMSAAICVLEEIKNQNLLKNVKETGEYLKSSLLKLPYVKEVRGFGLMLGVETEFKPVDIIKKCLDKGLLVLGAGANTLRLVPPLIVSKNEIDIALEIISSSFEELAKKPCLV